MTNLDEARARAVAVQKGGTVPYTNVYPIAADVLALVYEVERLRAYVPGLTATLDAYDYELRRLRSVVCDEDVVSIDGVLVQWQNGAQVNALLAELARLRRIEAAARALMTAIDERPDVPADNEFDDLASALEAP